MADREVPVPKWETTLIPKVQGTSWKGEWKIVRGREPGGQLQRSVFGPWQIYTQELSSRMADCLVLYKTVQGKTSVFVGGGLISPEL